MREGGSRDGFPRDPNGQPRQGFQDQDGGGLHRGPRRSRYGRRRGPSDGPGDTGGGGYNQPPRAPEPDLDEGDNFLPSFIAGPSNGGPDQSAGPQGHPSHTPGHGQSPNQGHNPSHQPGHNPGHQPGHNPSQYGGGQSGGGYQGQPSHQSHGGPVHQPSHQGGQPGGHQPVHHEPLPPEEPSPEVQAAAAEFAEWEASNPKLRGLLICTPTVKRGEPLVRGTRIPARILAAIAKMGSSVEEMLQDYPALTQEGLDAALAFAKACPRQAR
ncbi:MAG: DUF433 domain-containing protein [Proteobacteria bacterium]|nr:DUF433 domain-containing protein [Pseudomonadota bacterium]